MNKSHPLETGRVDKLLKVQTAHDYMLLHMLPAAIYTCDLEGRLTYFNPAAEKLWGRKPELYKDLWCGSFKIYRTDGTPLPLDQCPMARVLRNHTSVRSQEILIERPDGTRLNIMVNPKLIRDEAGNSLGAINMMVDVSEKRQKEKALLLSEKKYKKLAEKLESRVQERSRTLSINEQRYQLMVEEVQDYAIILLDLDGNILNWNKGVEKIKGYTENQIVGRNFRIFYMEEDRANLLPERLLKEALMQGRASHEGWRVKKNGTRFWGSVVLTLLRESNGKPIGFAKVTRDLTERKLAEDKLVRYSRDIEIRNKQLEEYAHIASHDLQEPLRKVQIYSDLMKDSLENKNKALKYLERIHTSAQRMSSLIKDVLLYSEVSHAEKLFTAVDLNQVLMNVREDLDLLIVEKKVRFSVKNLPVVQAIPIQMRQLFGNLIGNSIKFSQNSPRISIRSRAARPSEIKKITHLDPHSSYIKLTFKDNGMGFDPQFSDTIFILFKRLNADALGNGIGLPLCKKIVDNHSGHIQVQSFPGKGTTFNVFMPDSVKSS